MGKLLLMLFAMLALLVVLFAEEMDWIDLKKTFASEEPYSPPPQIGWAWRWHNNDRGLRSWADVTFFEAKPDGNIAVLGSGQCRWPCW
jgi:hypothetical protein